MVISWTPLVVAEKKAWKSERWEMAAKQDKCSTTTTTTTTDASTDHESRGGSCGTAAAVQWARSNWTSQVALKIVLV